VTTLQANPAQDRQLPDDPHLLLLWRDGTRSRREGLLLVVDVCPFPGCTDRHVLVEGWLVPETLRQVTCAGGELRFEPDGGARGTRPGRVFGVTVGIDDGVLEVVDAVWSRRAVAWLEGALDDELRAALARRFQEARARVDAALGERGAADPALEELGAVRIPEGRLEAVLAGFERGLAALEGRRGGARAPRTGRNDPCPCGSGRKYKRCCLGAA
jgi:hypothetical protein